MPKPFAQLSCGALAIASFLSVAAWVRDRLPWPVEYSLRAKLEYFTEHKDEFDTLFIGTSRVFHGVDNVQIERDLAERGIAMHSFNLGVAGMKTWEQDHLLRAILALEPARLERIFYEGGPTETAFRFEEETFSSRSVHWHTLRQTLLVLDAVRRRPGSLTFKAGQVWTHLQILGRHLANYGQGRRLLPDLKRDGDPVYSTLSRDELDGMRGYLPPDARTGEEFSPTMEELFRDPRPFEERMRAIVDENRQPLTLDQVSTLSMRDELEATRRHGVDLVFFTTPGYEGTPERPFLHRQGLIPALFDFNRPELYPELFRLDHRYDPKHLNRLGAERFSHLMADAIAEHLRAGSDL